MERLALFLCSVCLCCLVATDVENTTESLLCDSPDGNCNKVNVALNKEASMSAAYSQPGKKPRPASLAVDGNTSTYPPSCVHSLGSIDRDPDWWQVDLGRPYTITNITIYHREGGGDRYPHSQRIAGVWVYVDDELCYKFPDSLDIGNERKEKDDISCTQPIRGQVVRLSKEGFIHAKHYSFINVCEVQIWVCRSGLYGPNCEQTCDSHCQQGSCDNYNGTCDIEVQYTTESPLCDSPDGNCNKEVQFTSESPLCDSPDGNCNREVQFTSESPLCDSPDGNCNREVQFTSESPLCDSPDGNCNREVQYTTESPLCDSSDGNCRKVNVALNKAASMSAAYSEPGEKPGPASLAVDGNTSTDYRSCMHTLGSIDSDPDWWQVDLGRPYTITNISIYHREGGWDPNPHSQRIAGVWVYVDDDLCYKFPNSLNIGSERKEKDDISCTQPIRGQVVRLSKEGYIHAKHYSFINVCEVQIWVCRSGLYGPQCERKCDSHCQQGSCDNYDGTCDIGCSDGYYGADCSEQCGQCHNEETCDRHTGQCPHGCQPGYKPPDCQDDMGNSSESESCGSPYGNCNKVNVALDKAANQSSRYSSPGWTSGPPSLAVDGNVSTCVHTAGFEEDDTDWWEVNLGDSYTINHIIVYHAEGGHAKNPHSQRISGLWVYVNDTLCYKFPDSLSIGTEPRKRDDITCTRPIRGSIIRFIKNGFIHAKHYSFINFCEVQIWVCKPGLHGDQCEEECDSHCQQGVCDNYDGTCLVGCSDGYYGADCSEQCGQCHNEETCDRHTGQCPHGCQPGYKPPDCQDELEKTTASPPCNSPDGNCNRVNVALNKAASMSAAYSEPGGKPGPASLAVDGNTSTYPPSCVHTLGTIDSNPDWWQVDLGRPYTITDITIYHREGGGDLYPHSQRISGVWVYVDDDLCYKFPNSLNIGSERKEKDDISCTQPIKGQVVRLSKEGYIHAKHYSFINVCEVQIWVCRSGLYGPQCEQTCDSQCEQGLCDNYDGTCDIENPSSDVTENPSCDSPDGDCNKVNVAEGKEANMSVPYEQPGYSSGPAGLAVDGNTSTDYRSCVHTQGTIDNAPDWWQVDLGRPYTITNISIYHREGGSQSHPFTQRIAGVWVYVDKTLCYKFPDSYSIGRERTERDDITCRRPIRGQIVRFDKNGLIHAKHYSFINFCEVQIWVCKPGLYGPHCDNACDCQQALCDNYDGTCFTDVTEVSSTTESPSCDASNGNCNKVNVAQGKEASMSAPYVVPGYRSGPASLAVDGNTSTDYRSCVHTLGSADKELDWWQVDLGRPYTITNITIYHREGGPSPNPFSQRIAGIWIYVDDAICYKFPNSFRIGRTPKERDDITCQQPITGRVVRFSKDGFIHAKHFSFINFCEVQIWVCKSGFYGPQCDKTCDSHCDQGLCDNYDGTCETEVVSTTLTPGCEDPEGSCKQDNVAEGKKASMSPPYKVPGYSSGPASLAVDGNTSTDYRSCVHTQGSIDSHPDWWQVDLGRPYTITNITIYHREGGSPSNPFTQRIAGVWVYVDDALCYKFPDSYNIGSEREEREDITCLQPIRGQIVRFAKNDVIHAKHYSFINFCEVQIWVCKSGLYGPHCENACDCQQGRCDNYYGTCVTELERTTKNPLCLSPDGNCDRENVALGKEASMSAPYVEPGYHSGPASLAVDGNTSMYYRSCVHTQGSIDNHPDWWQVDLGRPYTITNISIYHREGGSRRSPLSQRIAGIWVYVDGRVCYKFPNSVDIGTVPERDDITCQRPMRGRVVRFAKDGFIHSKYHSFINFCEVQIWVCRSGLYGPRCDRTCDSHCQQGLCDNYDGTCDIGCSDGYYGADCSEQCGQCHNEETCDRHTGQCPHGCQPGYKPPDCQFAFTTSTQRPVTTAKTTTSTRSSSRPTTRSSSRPTSSVISLRTYAPPSVSTATDRGEVVLKNNSHSQRPRQNNASKQHSIGDVNSSGKRGSSDKKYTHGDMAGIAVAMILLGALLGIAGFAVYYRFFRRRVYSSDGIPFTTLHSSADT